eukprot:jgi/Picsp_1/2230/NSC_05694-R1_hypothetical protein CHLNCDRAFT_58696 [Chlorella variabilis]
MNNLVMMLGKSGSGCGGKHLRKSYAGKMLVRPAAGRCVTRILLQRTNCLYEEDSKNSAATRRDLMWYLSLMASFACAPAYAENEAITRGLGKYVKRKKLDRIDSYVPPLFRARDQLIRIGRVMLQSPTEAREQLRSGAFSGLRENVRSVGEYVSEQKGSDEGKVLVRNFFQELEGLDFVLLSSSREGELRADEARTKLDSTIKRLDLLLEEIPKDILDKARNVIDVVEGLETKSEEDVDMNELNTLQKLF